MGKGKQIEINLEDGGTCSVTIKTVPSETRLYRQAEIPDSIKEKLSAAFAQRPQSEDEGAAPSIH